MRSRPNLTYHSPALVWRNWENFDKFSITIAEFHTHTLSRDLYQYTKHGYDGISSDSKEMLTNSQREQTTIRGTIPEYNFPTVKVRWHSKINDVFYAEWYLHHTVRRDGSVGTATRYGLDDPGSNPGGGEIFRTRPDRLRAPSSLLHNWYRAGAWHWTPTHT
jgi:hypothetical protein